MATRGVFVNSSQLHKTRTALVQEQLNCPLYIATVTTVSISHEPDVHVTHCTCVSVACVRVAVFSAETAEASTSGRKKPPADGGTSAAKQRYSI